MQKVMTIQSFLQMRTGPLRVLVLFILLMVGAVGCKTPTSSSSESSGGGDVHSSTDGSPPEPSRGILRHSTINPSTPGPKRWDDYLGPSRDFVDAGLVVDPVFRPGDLRDPIAYEAAVARLKNASNNGHGGGHQDLMLSGRYLYQAASDNPEKLKDLLATEEGHAMFRDFVGWANNNYKDRNRFYVGPAIGIRKLDLNAAFESFDLGGTLTSFAPGNEINATYWSAIIGLKHSLAKPSNRMEGKDYGLDLSVMPYRMGMSISEENHFPVYGADVEFEGVKIRLYLYKQWRLDKPSESEKARWYTLEDAKGNSKWMLTLAGGPVIEVGSGSLSTTFGSNDSFSGRVDGGVGAQLELLYTIEGPGDHEVFIGPFIDGSWTSERRIGFGEASGSLGGGEVTGGIKAGLSF